MTVRSRFAICLTSLVLASCAQEPPPAPPQQALASDKVRDPTTAIAIGIRACAQGLARQDTSQWTATYEDGIWHVSGGERNGAPQVDVTAATGEAGMCMELVIVG